MKAKTIPGGLVLSAVAVLSVLTSCSQPGAGSGVTAGAATTLALAVSKVAVTTSSTGSITGVTATIKNTGTADASALPYDIDLSSKATLDTSVTLPTIYSGSVTLAAGASKTVTLGLSDIATYLASATTPANGDYYLALLADPANTSGSGPYGAETTTKTWFINGSLALFAVSGAISTSGSFPPPGDPTGHYTPGTYTVYVGLIDPSNTVVSSASQTENITPQQIFVSGSWTTITTYLNSGGILTTGAQSQAPPPFEVGAQESGTYYVGAFADMNGNGTLEIAYFSPVGQPQSSAYYAPGEPYNDGTQSSVDVSTNPSNVVINLQ